LAERILVTKKKVIMDISENQTTIFPKGNRASNEYYTGTVWVKNLVPATDTFNTLINNLEYEPGARTNWHTHQGGQILLVTNGTGYYQEKGKPIQLLRKGDLVQVLPNVEHWHGASANSQLTHLAVNTNTQQGTVEWLQSVTDEEYNSFE
jgi:quercetin dioxygenase-like cupin family protein